MEPPTINIFIPRSFGYKKKSLNLNNQAILLILILLNPYKGISNTKILIKILKKLPQRSPNTGKKNKRPFPKAKSKDKLSVSPTPSNRLSPWKVVTIIVKTRRKTPRKKINR